VFYNATAQSISAWHGDCKFTGFSLLQNANKNNAGDCVFSQQYATSKMAKDANMKIAWDDKSFGSWLVCNTNGANVLKYWDATSSAKLDTDKCAQVQLNGIWN